MHIITIIKQQQWFWELNPEDKGIRWLRPGQVNYDLMISSKYLDTLFNTLFNIHLTSTKFVYLAILQYYFTFYIWQNLHLMGKCPKFGCCWKMDCTEKKRSPTSENIWLFGHFKNENAELKAWMTTLPKSFPKMADTRWGYSSIENLGYSLRYNCKILLENISFKLLFWDTYFFIIFFSYTLTGDHFMLLLFVISHCKVLQGKIFSKNLFL